MNYTDSSIKVLEGLEAVRKRPGMYIGSTDVNGLHHLVWEIFDNSIDEVLAGFADEVNVTLTKSGTVIIEDNGRGIPVGRHPQTGKSTLETVFTVLHAGGKFDESVYKSSGGLHGVGASVVNALSEWIKVEIKKNGFIYQILFSDGGRNTSEITKVGPTKKTGTIVEFKPDHKIFKVTEFTPSVIQERIKEAAFLLKGLTVRFTNELAENEEERFIEFSNSEGLTKYVDYINEGRHVIHPPILFSGNNGGIEVEVAIQYSEVYQETIVGFANNVKTPDGGTHINGFKIATSRAINNYVINSGLLKEKDKRLEGVDCREGLTAVISVRIPESLILYDGQTKSKLGTLEARGAVDSIVSDSLYFWLLENKTIANKIVDKILNARKSREAAQKARKASRESKNKNFTLLSGKLTPAQSKDPKKKELYLVEGDSAGGSAKLGRDRKFQAILPLRGKVINAEKAKLDDLLKNEEISTIINTIGSGFGNDFEIGSSKYGKIIIMTDADTDGAHIQVLLLTFFFRYMRPLIEAGLIYVAMPPLFKITGKNGKEKVQEYCWTEQELLELKENLKSVVIQRYKGLGEMNSDQLWETTMNPETRNLIKVTLTDSIIAEKRVSTLMGDNSEIRKQWINNNVRFTNQDEFDI